MSRPLRSVRPTLACLEPRRLCDAGQHQHSPLGVRQVSGEINTGLPSAAERSQELPREVNPDDPTESRRLSADSAGELDDGAAGDGGRSGWTRLSNSAVTSKRAKTAALPTGATVHDQVDSSHAVMAMVTFMPDMVTFMPGMQVVWEEPSRSPFGRPHSETHAIASLSYGASPLAMASASHDSHLPAQALPAHRPASSIAGHRWGDMAVHDRSQPIPEHDPEGTDALFSRNGEMPRLEPGLDAPSATSWVRIRPDEHQADAPELTPPDSEGGDAMPPVGRQHEVEPAPGQKHGEVVGEGWIGGATGGLLPAEDRGSTGR
jgi:hypothetical protein